jgi:uncharacterized protein (TIRG00374 family)
VIKQSLVFAIKLALALAIIFWLYQSEVLDLAVVNRLSFDSLTIQLISLSSLLIFCGAMLISVRIWYLLRVLELDLLLPDAMRINLAALGMGMMLPGQMGVDAIRVTYFCIQRPDRKMRVVSAVLFDRILGVYALLLLATIATLCAFAIGVDVIHVNIATFLLLTLGMVSGTFLLFSSKVVRASRLFNAIYRRLPSIFKSIFEALELFINHKQAVFLCIGISIASQLCTILGFVIMGILIQDTLPVLAHFIINPIALLLNGIPLTPGGLGITESAFAYLYLAADSQNGAVISLLGRLNQYLVYAIIGIPALFLIRR